MSDELTPMVVMVCWRCREGAGHPEHSMHHGLGSPCREEGCAFFGFVASPKPARTREELVDLGARGLAAIGMPASPDERTAASAVLAAAGVIEPREQEGS